MEHSPRRRELRDAAWLSLLPLGVALVLGLLLAPRQPTPEGVPVPIADSRSLARTMRADQALAAAARAEPLPGVVRALGTAIRDFHTLEAAEADLRELGRARHAVDSALMDVVAPRAGLPQTPGDPPYEALLRLRAVELDGFLVELRKFADTGEQSPELLALAGGFVRSMTNEGWCEGRALAPDVTVLRVMFKRMWNAFLGFDRKESPVGAPTGVAATASPNALALTVDEERVLYAFYLSHPHPSRAARETIASARIAAVDARSCRALAVAEDAAIASWQLDHIGRLAMVDPSYPADYARGVARFGRGEYGASADAFRKWLADHPEGPLALRAQNYLRAAAEANRLE
jgi:hypothetical protein